MNEIKLTKELAQLYTSLPSSQRSLFTRILRGIYNHFFQYAYFKGREGLLYLQWLISGLCKHYNITSNQLYVLSLIYYLTDKGKGYTTITELREYMLLDRVTYSTITRKLIEKNYIKRIKNPPARIAHYLAAPRGRARYIMITPTGIQFVTELAEYIKIQLYEATKKRITKT
jgi:DNA-binding MarR family transcriptional regulator